MAWSTTGCNVDTGKQTASSILFSRAGSTTIRQIETEEVMEVRGLTAAAGKGKVPDASNVVDNTTQTTYYAFIGGVVHTINVISGSKEEWSAMRKDESGQWYATKRTKTYSSNVGSVSAWGTTPLDETGTAITLSASGVSKVISVDKSTSFVFDAMGDVLTASVTTEVLEYRYVKTKANADTIVNANTSASSQGTARHGTVTVVIVPVQTGTEKFASSRFVSAEAGWTVTVTKKTYTHQGTNWS